jgi:hypothetical protein
MGKLFFSFFFVAAAASMQAQSIGRPVMIVSPHIQTPTVVHIPRVNLPQARSFANTQAFRSLYNPLNNDPLVNRPGEEVNAATQSRVRIVPSTRRVPLGTTVEALDRTAVNGYTVGTVRQVQQALHRLGYYNGDVDGDFGASTQNALERYQVGAGEPVTGTLNHSVLGRLGVSGR